MNLHTKIKLNRFSPREYQKPVLDALFNKDYKRLLTIWPRRAGKDLVGWNIIIRAALLKVGVYFYCAPTYSQGRKIIWDSISNDAVKFLDFLPSEIIERKNDQMMKIHLKNGSLIQIIGSDSYDNSIVGSNPQGIIFTEWALSDERAWQFARPILMANDGWALFNSCVAPNTLVIGENGLRRISTLSDSREEYTDYNKPIWGLGGFHNAEQFYYGGKQTTYTITLESGFQLECTPIHPIWNGNEWIKTKDLKLGDLIPIQYGQNKFGDGADMSEFDYSHHGHLKITMADVWNRVDTDVDFWYLLGLIHADGNYDKSKITITNKKDPEIQSFLKREGFQVRKDGIHFELCSKLFCAFLEYFGFKHGALNKTFPDKLLESKRWQLESYLQGLFDGDGSSHAKRGTVKFTTGCQLFAKDLQIILLNFGIVASLYREEKGPTELVKNSSVIYNLEINGVFAAHFYHEIGFRLSRKQNNKEKLRRGIWEEPANVYPIDTEKLKDYKLPKNIITNPHRITRKMIAKLNEKKSHPYLEQILEEKFFYSPVKSIEISENEVFDFVIPKTHSFFSNGFISHNTPRGKNHLWAMYQIALHSSQWFCQKLTVDDTKHIDEEVIQRERASGEMSEDLIQQEYYTSFEMGVEGSFYAKYIDEMRRKGQISVVPFEQGFPVHTAWDIGVRDSTCIIFFQIIGQTVRIIDCYDNTKEGLEHYVQVMEEKKRSEHWTYGKHFAPHDIAVTEWGTGLSRVEKAAHLGLKFEVSRDKYNKLKSTVPQLSIMDGIEAVRSSFSKIWIDEKKCAPLIKSLENYRQEFDAKRKVYKHIPLHDINSHYADGMRYLCLSLKKLNTGQSSAEELERRYRETVYGYNQGGFFGGNNNRGW